MVETEQGREGTPSAVTVSPGGLLCTVFRWKLDLLVAAMHKAGSLWHRPIMFLSAGNDVGEPLLNKAPLFYLLIYRERRGPAGRERGVGQPRDEDGRRDDKRGIRD